MALSLQLKKMRGAILLCLAFISTLNTALNIHSFDDANGIFPIVLADPIARAITRGIIRNGNPSLHNNASTFLAFETPGSKRSGKNNRCFVDKDNDNLLHKSSSQLLCLHPLTARSEIYLRTLYCDDSWEEAYGYVDEKGNVNTRHVGFCWESVPNVESGRTPESVVFSSEPEHENVITAGTSLPSTLILNGSIRDQKDKLSLRSIALKVDLLFTTTMVKNNEILLPLSIVEYYREEYVSDSLSAIEDITSLPGKASDPRLQPSKSSMVSQLRSITDKSLYADRWVDLTGRWRPSQSISTQDLVDYNTFLTVCCSDQISYWTRQLLTSSSIVSRQEMVVEQFDKGRIVEFVDIHPLSSNVWNRTIATSIIPGYGNKSRLKKNSPIATRQGDRNVDSYRPYVNRSRDPQGDPILIEAYWQKNGTVHTSLLRKECNHGDEDGNCSANNGWFETKRYLIPGKSRHESNEVKEDVKKREMIVETIYYSTPFPTEAGSTSNEKQEETTTTRMLWKWEQVIESSR